MEAYPPTSLSLLTDEDYSKTEELFLPLLDRRQLPQPLPLPPSSSLSSSSQSSSTSPSPPPMSSTTTGACVICGTETKTRCGPCLKAGTKDMWFCSAAHQRRYVFAPSFALPSSRTNRLTSLASTDPSPVSQTSGLSFPSPPPPSRCSVPSTLCLPEFLPPSHPVFFLTRTSSTPQHKKVCGERAFPFTRPKPQQGRDPDPRQP
jgi:hypothetical protein